jgi:hypothetical protein
LIYLDNKSSIHSSSHPFPATSSAAPKAKINYEVLGYLHFRVFLHLSKLDEEVYSKIKSFLKARGNIESVSKYMGYADIDFRCYSKSIIELYNLISEVKDKFLTKIIEVNSMPIFSWSKIEYY